MSAFYKDDTGIKMIIQFNNKENGVTTSDYDEVKLLVKKPNGDKVEWNCNIDTDNNIISYTIDDGDLDIVGLYVIQPKVKIGDYNGRATAISINVME